MNRALVLLVLVGVLLAGASSAQAGTYTVSACGQAGVNRTWTITPLPAGMEASTTCSADSAMPGAWVRDILRSPTPLPDGEGAWLRFDAVPGTTIAGLTYTRRLWKVALDELHPELRTGEGVVLETCAIASGTDRCQRGGEGSAPVTFGSLNTTRLEFGVRCQMIDFGTRCPGGGTMHAYGAELIDAQVLVRDDSAPSTPTVASSGLWSGASWYRGASSIAVSGSDVSGVRAIRLYSGSRLVREQTVSCDFTAARPCPAASSTAVAIDTRLLGEGTVDVATTLVDAAGNESSRVGRTVTIANEPPPAPVLAIAPSSRSTDPNFSVTWTPAREPVLPIALAHVTVCRAGSCTTSTTSERTVPITATGLGETTVSIWLEDLAGNGTSANASTTTFTLDAPPPPERREPEQQEPPGGGGGQPPADPPPGPGPTPPPSDPPGERRSPSTPTRAAARLRLGATVTGGRVRVVARISTRASGRVAVTVRWRSGKRWSRPRTYRIVPRRGASTLTLRRPRGASQLRLQARYAGDRHVLAGSARRSLRLR